MIDYNNREDFILYCPWDNSWVTALFRSQCSVLCEISISFNVYKIKGLFFCEPCYKEIKKRHENHGVAWSAGEIYWNSLQSPELK